MPGQLVPPPSAMVPISTQLRVRNIDDTSWFGPMQPLPPQAPAGTQPRQLEYVQGQNLIWTPRSNDAIQFSDMIYLADNCDLVRIVIENLKDQLCLLPWQIRVKSLPNETEAQRSERQKSNSRVQYWNDLLQWPNPEQSWGDFLRMLLEDLLVLDAPSILLQRNRGGDIGALRVIDGQTITRIIDDSGFTPLPPNPAYEQVLYGMPALYLTSDQLVYRPRVQRARKLYGCSPIEQILMTLNIAIRRQRFQLNYYTEGNVPEALYTMPGNVTEDQVRRFQKWFDSELKGDLAKRRRIWFIPGDDKGASRLHWTKAELIKDEADEWFARVICFAFRISPKELIKVMNRATAEESQDSAEEMGVRSVALWLVDTINSIIQRKSGHPDDREVEFGISQKQDADSLKQAQTDKIYVDLGIRTRNQIRSKLGDDPSPDPMANVLGVTTPQGFIPLDQVNIQNDMRQQQMENDAAAAKQKQQQSQSGGAGGKKRPTQDSKAPNPTNNQKVWKALSKAEARRHEYRISAHDEHLKAEAVSELQATLNHFFKQSETQVVSRLEEVLGLDKADEPKLERALKATDLDWDSIVDAVEKALYSAGANGGSIAIDQLKLANVSMLAKASDAARAWARNRAAELVGKTWDGAQLVDNPDARWAISETTRTELRRIITHAFEKKLSYADMVDEIAAAGAFAPWRAKMIARTEVARAQTLAQVTVWKLSGKVKSTYWVTSADGPCDECQENRDAGAVELGKAFPTGDVAPPSHPNCRCALVVAEISE